MYKLFSLCLLLGACYCATAQKTDGKKQPAKANASTKSEYQVPGSPLAKLKLVSLDTLSQKYKGRKLKKINKKNTAELGYTPLTTVYTNNNLNDGKPLIVMIFNPTCGHCEDEIDHLEKNVARLGEARLVLVSNPLAKAYLPDFVKTHKINDFYPNILAGIDSSGFIDNVFQYTSLPQLTIYSRDRKLLKIYSGETLVDSLVQWIK